MPLTRKPPVNPLIAFDPEGTLVRAVAVLRFLADRDRGEQDEIQEDSMRTDWGRELVLRMIEDAVDYESGRAVLRSPSVTAIQPAA